MINCVKNTLSTPVSDLRCLLAYWELKKKFKKKISKKEANLSFLTTLNSFICFFPEFEANEKNQIEKNELTQEARRKI